MSGAASNVKQYEAAMFNQRYLTELDRRTDEMTEQECVESLHQLKYLQLRVKDRIVALVERRLADATNSSGLKQGEEA